MLQNSVKRGWSSPHSLQMGVPCSQHLFKGWALLQSPLKWVGLGPKAFQKSKILSYIHTYIQGGCWVYFALHHGLLLPAECIPLHKCLPLYHYITFQPIVAHPGCSPCWSLRCLPQTIHTKKACFWVVLHRHSRQPKGPLQDVATASVPQANVEMTPSIDLVQRPDSIGSIDELDAYCGSFPMSVPLSMDLVYRRLYDL